MKTTLNRIPATGLNNVPLSLNRHGLVKRLKQMRAKSEFLSGRAVDGTPLNQYLKGFFDDRISAMEDPNSETGTRDFLARAIKDSATHQEMCAIRVEQFQNYLLADLNLVGMFFEIINLADDERPVEQNNTDNETTVSKITANGQPKSFKIPKDQSEALVDLEWLSSDDVTYRLIDPYRGNIVDAALQTLRLAYDMDNKLEGLAFTLLGTALGAFTLTGNRPNRVYVANSRINTAQLPTTNSVTVDSSTTGTLFRFPVLAAIKKYGEQWGNAFLDGPLAPTGRVLVPASQISDIASGITPSGAHSNPVADELLQMGYTSISYLGINWMLIPDNTLPLHACYPEWNKKAGHLYLKPGLDMEIRDDSKQLLKQNLESRFMKKIFGMTLNSAHRPRFTKFIYNTT